MSERHSEFGDTDIAVITFTDPDHLARYRDHLDIEFPVVTDIERVLYHALGIERGTRRQVWSFGTLRMYAELLAKKRLLRRPTEDVRQLGADVVIDAGGRIHKIFRPATPDARPTVDQLLAALPTG